MVKKWEQRVTVQPAELLRHPAIENRFAMGQMPAGTTFSYGLCSKCTDLAELLQQRRCESEVKERKADESETPQAVCVPGTAAKARKL